MDGFRGEWDGTHLRSRNGNIINAPRWFTKDFPKTPLDGEIWAGRGSFELGVSGYASFQTDQKSDVLGPKRERSEDQMIARLDKNFASDLTVLSLFAKAGVLEYLPNFDERNARIAERSFEWAKFAR